jgi:hypothetical protein
VRVLSLGLHWAVLQTIAWTGIIVSYSRDASFSEAASKTLDGEHPCPMCKVIKKARTAEKQQEQEQKQQVKPGSKMDLDLVWQCTSSDFSSIRSNEPPKRPPRTA